MSVSPQKIKELRDMTGAGVINCKKALEEAEGSMEKAQLLLREKGKASALKKAARDTSQGLVHAYIHNGDKVGALVKVLCETDFVARTPEFGSLVHNIAMQVAALRPETLDELLASEYIKDPKKKISDLMAEAVTQMGENIKVGEFVIYEIQ
ncbi:MAG: translation elongation factor Ts [bacterium]